MKLEKSTVQIFRDGDIIETAFGISEKDSAHILAILRDKLYSNKILAVIREYSANATDAHVENGCPDRPIEVCLPTRMETTFRVRDYGQGLTEDEVRNIYVKYGASTKRNTNSAIGQLGLGSKAGFAYADSFTITVYKGGTKTVYNAYIDETKIGMLAKIGESKTKEEDGVEVAVPVKAQDISTFEQEARELFYYFELQPKLSGIINPLGKPTINLSGAGWILDDSKNDNRPYNHRSDAVVVMGGIPYPIDSRQLEASMRGKTEGVDYFTRCSFILTVPIGDVSVSANREALEYTEKTVQTLCKLIKNVAKEIVAKINDELNMVESKFRARVLLYKYYQSSKHHFLRYFLDECSNSKGKYNWHGQTIEPSSYISLSTETKDLVELRTAEYSLARRARRPMIVRRGSYHSISISYSEHMLFMEEDTNNARWLLKAEQVAKDYMRKNDLPFDTTNVSIMLLKFKTHDAAKREETLSDIGLIESDIIKLSSVVLPKINRAKTGRGHNSKHSHKLFTFKVKAPIGKVRSDSFTEVDVSLANGGYYFIIDSFYWMSNKTCPIQLQALQYIIADLVKIGALKESDIIYAVKIKEAHMLESLDNWILLDTLYKTEMKKYLDDNKLPQLLVDFREVHLLDRCSWFSGMKKYMEKLAQDSPFKSVYDKVYSMQDAEGLKDTVESSADMIRRYNDYTGTSLPKPTKSKDELMRAIHKTYPLTAHIEFWDSYYYNDPKVKGLGDLIDYVNMIDKRNGGN